VILDMAGIRKENEWIIQPRAWLFLASSVPSMKQAHHVSTGCARQCRSHSWPRCKGKATGSLHQQNNMFCFGVKAVAAFQARNFAWKAGHPALSMARVVHHFAKAV
jgi:hypothetical protein